MGQYGHRNMFYQTGLPGWMRFGYSPGWVGRSASGLGPAAEYITTGRWPNAQMANQWKAMQGGASQPENEIQFLKQSAEMLHNQLETIQKRIDELEKK